MDRSVKAQVFAHTSSCVLSTTTGGRACAIHPNLCQGVLMNLLETYDSLLEDWRTVFSQNRTFERARRLTFGLLVCLRLHLTSRAICAVGRQFDSGGQMQTQTDQ